MLYWLAAANKKTKIAFSREKVVMNMHGYYAENKGKIKKGMDSYLSLVSPELEKISGKKYGVGYEMIVGEGLFHCYPVFPVTKESKEGWNQMINILKNC